MDSKSLVYALKMVSTIYPSVVLSKELVKSWEMLLADIPDELGTKAFEAHLKSSTFPPTPANIVSLVEEMKKTDDDVMTAEEGWKIALDLARKYGQERGGEASESIKQYPKLVHAIRTVGYRAICTTDYKELPFLKKQFIALFDQVSDRAQAQLKIINLNTKLLKDK